MEATGDGSDYRVIESLGEVRGEQLYRARDAAGRSVVLKVLGSKGLEGRRLERLENEFRIAAKVGTRAVVRPIALDRFRGFPALVLEDVGGRTLDRVVDGPLELGRFLRLAVAAAAALEDVHRHGVIHKDLRPPNLIVDELGGRVRISGFGSASLMPREQEAAGNPTRMEGTLAYMSPEQTGRIHRALDYRTDLYSLGVTFYEMLTGRLPFTADDPLGWVHCHIARAPAPPVELVPRLPEPISQIVMKLLAKAAEDRYQSAAGLRFDLETCQRQWNAAGRIEAFALATRDVSERLQIPQKLYGREAERRALLAAFDRVTESGRPRLLLLAGEAGVGKSSLGHELEAAVVRERGVFLSGKFDEHRRNVPYAPLVEALGGLLVDILTENDGAIAAWRARLAAALGASGQLLVERLPALELIIGKQPPVVDLPPREAQVRFALTLRKALGALPHGESPVVLFLDDLQWADPGSLELLRQLALEPEVGPLLMVGAHRTDDPRAGDGLASAVERLAAGGAAVDELVLGPLSPGDLADLCAETLHRSPEEAAPLAALVHRKTGGNPFFAHQFLIQLWQEGLLVLDEGRGWRWQLDEIAARGDTSNVVDFMVAKFRRLPEETQSVLRLAACLGRPFDAGSLATLAERADEDIEAALLPAVGELILYTDGLHRFAHDRIRDAAYQLSTADERALTHLRIARWLLAGKRPDELGDELFEAANQLAACGALITDPRERVRMAEVDLLAGRRAMASHAPAAAAAFLTAGLTLLGEDPWEAAPALAAPLLLARAECELLRGAAESALRDCARLIERAHGLGDRAAAHRLKQEAHLARGEMRASAQAELDRLALFGIELPRQPTHEDALAERARVRRLMGTGPLEALAERPPLRDPAVEAAIHGVPIIPFAQPVLFAVHSGRMAALALEHGLADVSLQWFSTYAFTLTSYFDEPVEAARLASLAASLVERRHALAYKATVHIASALVHFWTDPVDDYTAHATTGLEAALEIGAIRDINYAAMLVVRGLVARGERLERVEREADRRLGLTTFEDPRENLLLCRQFARALRGRTARVSDLGDADFDEAHLRGELPQPASRVGNYWVWKLRAAFLARDLGLAWEAAEQARAFLPEFAGQIAARDYHLYRALTMAALYPERSVEERERWLTEIREHERRLRRWAGINPRTFRANLAVVSAELARLTERFEEATRLYDDAARSARENQLPQDEALAYELGARFHREHGLETFADPYLRAARDAYARWGADGKVALLLRESPRLLAVAPEASADGFAAAAPLDVLAVVKASQAVSGEVVLDQLLLRLMEVVLEHSGAERGCLLLPRDGVLTVVAEARVAAGRIEVQTPQDRPLAEAAVPSSLLQYVSRTGERVVLPDAATVGRFTRDEYVARVRPRSVLCLPVRHTGELVGLLYLEHNRLGGAFTPERLAVLDLLASQAAISLEHARLLRQEREARAAAEQAGRRFAVLAEASALMAESLDVQVVLARLTELVVRHVGELCMIDLVEGPELRRVAHAHADPAKEPILSALSQHYPVRGDARRAPAEVVATGKALFYRGGSRQYAAERAVDAEHRRLLEALDSHSGVIVPLLARGRSVGCMSVASRHAGVSIPEADLALIEEIARRAAIAIDHAQLYKQTEEAVRTRDEFLHVASHELNTPLAALLLNLDAIKTLPPEHKENFRLLEGMTAVAHRQGVRLSRLVRELLDTTRIDRGTLSLARETVELGALVREVLAMYAPELAAAGCAVSVAQAAPVVGQWDPQRLHQLLLNLLSNATKFARGKPIEIAIDGSEGVVAPIGRISVTDHGIGIRPPDRARLFQRYQRGVSAAHYGGLGLGLYICQHIVEAHGGTISVESVLDQGATFTIALPLEPPGP